MSQCPREPGSDDLQLDLEQAHFEADMLFHLRKRYEDGMKVRGKWGRCAKEWYERIERKKDMEFKEKIDLACALAEITHPTPDDYKASRERAKVSAMAPGAPRIAPATWTRPEPVAPLIVDPGPTVSAPDPWEGFDARDPQPVNAAAVQGEPGRSYPSGGPIADHVELPQPAHNHGQRKRNERRTRRDTDTEAEWRGETTFPGMS